MAIGADGLLGIFAPPRAAEEHVTGIASATTPQLIAAVNNVPGNHVTPKSVTLITVVVSRLSS